MGRSNSRVQINSQFKRYSNEAKRAYNQALQDVVDDLVRTSSESAPHDEGILEKSWTKEIKLNGNEPYGVVSYAVKKQGGQGGNAGNFNYALKMHEESYNPGVKSVAKPGGTGMSGRTYPVGAGYLTGVLKGEEQTYINHIKQAVQNVNQNF